MNIKLIFDINFYFMKKTKSKIVGVAKQVLSEKTISVVKEHKADVKLSGTNEYAKAKYSSKNEKQKLIFTSGKDLLQYSIVVRPYILRKHRIKNNFELDILLYLFPIQYFSRRDFKVLPTINEGYHLTTLIDLNYIEVVVHHHKGANSNLYGLTERAKKIVKDYYEYLSGEKTVNPSSYTNPFADSDASKVDGLRQKLLNKLTRQTKTQPSLFRKSLYDF
jgi:hypothetical protein